LLQEKKSGGGKDQIPNQQRTQLMESEGKKTSKMHYGKEEGRGETTKGSLVGNNTTYKKKKEERGTEKKKAPHVGISEEREEKREGE